MSEWQKKAQCDWTIFSRGITGLSQIPLGLGSYIRNLGLHPKCHGKSPNCIGFLRLPLAALCRGVMGVQVCRLVRVS